MTAPEPFFSAIFRVRGSVFDRNFEKCKLLKGVCFRNEFREILAYALWQSSELSEQSTVQYGILYSCTVQYLVQYIL